MLSPLPIIHFIIGLEMTLDIASLRWVLRARIKLQGVSSPTRRNFAVVIFHSSRNGFSTQNSPNYDTKWI